MQRGQWGYAICNSWVNKFSLLTFPREDNVSEWIEEMKEWRHDVEVLAWVAKATKKATQLNRGAQYCANTEEILAAP